MLWAEEKHGSFQGHVLGTCLLEGGELDGQGN